MVVNAATGPQGELFDSTPILPEGLIYRPDFVTFGEEKELLLSIAALPFRDARYHQYTAKRQVLRFGLAPDDEDSDLPQLAFPDFLLPLRRRISAWLAVPESRFIHTLVTRYYPGTPIGWHRDAPHFETVVGISLAGKCRMRLRPLPPAKPTKEPVIGRPKTRRDIALELEPRSAYVLTGPVRWNWQHHIPPTKELRYSITLRTLAHGLRAARPRLDAQ